MTQDKEFRAPSGGDSGGKFLMGKPSTAELITEEERQELQEWFAREQGPW